MGEKNGCLSQYVQAPFGGFKKQKEYGDVGVGMIYACDLSENFAVVGGGNGMISLIDMKKKKVIKKGIKTAIQWIYTLQFCRLSQNKMYLAVGGLGERDYSKSKKDCLNVSKHFNFEENKEENVKITKNKLE